MIEKFYLNTLLVGHTEFIQAYVKKTQIGIYWYWFNGAADDLTIIECRVFGQGLESQR